jgi:hypothetical protein
MKTKDFTNYYNIGAAEENITPNPGVDLYSLDGVSRNSDKIHSDLVACAVAISHNKCCIIIVSLDLIWIDDEFSLKIKKWVKTKSILTNTNVVIVATHSHSTPQISNKITNTARPNAQYNDILYSKICNLILKSIENMDQCYAKLSISSPGISVNRRKKILDPSQLKKFNFKTKIANRPNLKTQTDDLLYSIWFYDKNGIEKAVLLNYACHASLYRKNSVSSDYPGMIRAYLKNNLSPELKVCFLQGFSGDIKANIVESQCSNQRMSIKEILFSIIFDNYRFKKNITDYDIKKFSKILALNAIKNENTYDIHPKLSYLNKTIKLPLHNKLNFINLELCYISLGKKLKMIMIGGEVFSQYSIWMRNYLSNKGIHLLTVGYCNDIVGYLPTKQAINEGGYEVERTTDFPLKTTISEEIESIIKSEFIKVVNKCQENY